MIPAPTAASQIQALNDIKDPILQKCRDYYKISAEMYDETVKEGQEIIDMYHNRQYTQAQLLKLRELGQPAETFNIIRMFTNVIIGYLETVVTDITAVPRYPGTSVLANITNDVIQSILAASLSYFISLFPSSDFTLNIPLHIPMTVATTLFS